MNYQRPDDVLDAQGRYKTNKKLCKVHKWCFTLYDEPWCSTGIPYGVIPEQLHWICGQPEYNKTFKPGTNEYRQHFQGALVSKDPIDYPTLRRQLGMVKSRFAPMKGSIKSNIEYTSKEDGSTVYDADGVQQWRELGAVPENFKQNGESLNEMVAQLKEGADFKDMLELNAGAAIRHHAGLERAARAYAEPPERNGVQVYYIYGKTDLGKSHVVYKFLETTPGELYTKFNSGKNNWWEGYEGRDGRHVAVIFNDFRPQRYEMDDLLRWFDKWPDTVPVKGSSRPLYATRFYITTNVKIEDWYVKERKAEPELYQESYNALMRRIPPENRVEVVSRPDDDMIFKNFAEYRAYQIDEKRKKEMPVQQIGAEVPNNKAMELITQMTPQMLMEAMQVVLERRRQRGEDDK